MGVGIAGLFLRALADLRDWQVARTAKKRLAKEVVRAAVRGTKNARTKATRGKRARS